MDKIFVNIFEKAKIKYLLHSDNGIDNKACTYHDNVAVTTIDQSITRQTELSQYLE